MTASASCSGTRPPCWNFNLQTFWVWNPTSGHDPADISDISGLLSGNGTQHQMLVLQEDINDLRDLSNFVQLCFVQTLCFLSPGRFKQTDFPHLQVARYQHNFHLNYRSESSPKKSRHQKRRHNLVFSQPLPPERGATWLLPHWALYQHLLQFSCLTTRIIIITLRSWMGQWGRTVVTVG